MPGLDRPIAVTTCPRTRPCADRVTQLLQDRGCQVRVFESSGRTFESSVRTGEFDGAIDLSLSDLAAELLKTGFGAGPDRLTAAATMRIPNLIVLGGLDAAEVPSSFRPPNRDCVEFENRRYIRTMPAECDRLGQEIAFKASVAEETTSVLIPLGGLSGLDVLGGPTWLPDSNRALFQSLKNWNSPRVTVDESPLSIADPAMGNRIVECFLRFAPVCVTQPARNEAMD